MEEKKADQPEITWRYATLEEGWEAYLKVEGEYRAVSAALALSDAGIADTLIRRFLHVMEQLKPLPKKYKVRPSNGWVLVIFNNYDTAKQVTLAFREGHEFIDWRSLDKSDVDTDASIESIKYWLAWIDRKDENDGHT